jgi:hypothetical protein
VERLISAMFSVMSVCIASCLPVSFKSKPKAGCNMNNLATRHCSGGRYVELLHPARPLLQRLTNAGVESEPEVG